MLADIGIELSRQTMSSWVLRCGELLIPLYQRLKEKLLSQAAIHADETPLNVINAENRQATCGCIAVVGWPDKDTNIGYISTCLQHIAEQPDDFELLLP